MARAMPVLSGGHLTMSEMGVSMSDKNIDEGKGRLKEAAGSLTGDDHLKREGKLDHFVLDAEQIFELSYAGELLYCIFSREHVFAVLREEFAASLEQAVREIFAATSCPRLMEIGAAWGASAIRALPYASRFSESGLI